MISIDSSLISVGSSPWNSGLKPANRVVRSSAFWVWLSGIVALRLQQVVWHAGHLAPCSIAR